jgi:hypothetical protein
MRDFLSQTKSRRIYKPVPEKPEYYLPRYEPSHPGPGRRANAGYGMVLAPYGPARHRGALRASRYALNPGRPSRRVAAAPPVAGDAGALARREPGGPVTGGVKYERAGSALRASVPRGPQTRVSRAEAFRFPARRNRPLACREIADSASRSISPPTVISLCRETRNFVCREIPPSSPHPPAGYHNTL